MLIKSFTSDEFPFTASLTTIDNPPQMLYFIGEFPGRKPTVSIVGTRRPTKYGQEITRKIARELAEKGVIIVSGLALGVDALAHRGALEARGTTVAVLPTDLNHIYPRTNRGLAQEILAQGGAVLSEYEQNPTPHAHDFLRRNRLVSGLADVIIVTEATLRSGTTSTVNHALQQGKTVLAVPGNITSPTSQGCNKLIQQGAIPLTSVDDVLAELPGLSATPGLTQLPLGETPAEITIIQLIASGVQDGDELLKQSRMAVSEFNVTISMLEMKGVVNGQGGNWWGLR